MRKINSILHELDTCCSALGYGNIKILCYHFVQKKEIKPDGEGIIKRVDGVDIPL